MGLRTLVFVGPVLALLADRPAGLTTPPAVVLAVVALAAVSAVSPDSAAGAVADVVVVAWWGLGLHGAVPVSVLAAAAALLVSHVAAVVACYGPGSLTPAPAVLRRWAGRAVVLFAPAVALWVLDRVLRGASGPALLWPAGLLVCAAVAVAASLALAPARGPRREAAEGSR